MAGVRELETDERRDRVADVTVTVRQRAEKFVSGGEPAQQREFTDGAEPILLRVGVPAVADMGALTLDRHARPIPPQPPVLVGVRTEVARRDELHHRGCEQAPTTGPFEQVEP